MTPRPRFFAFVLGATVLLLSGCERDWPNYRYNQHRSGHQPWFGELSDPDDVPNLKVEWTWPSSGSEGGSFRASPIVYEHRVFIASTSGLPTPRAWYTRTECIYGSTIMATIQFRMEKLSQ